MEFYNIIFQAWKVMEFDYGPYHGKSWKLTKIDFSKNHRVPKRCISAEHNHLIKILLFTCVPVSF